MSGAATNMDRQEETEGRTARIGPSLMEGDDLLILTRIPDRTDAKTIVASADRETRIL